MSNDDSKDAIIQIVGAYAGRADVTSDDIVGLISKLKKEFSEPIVGRVVENAKRPTPAIPVSECVTEDKVFCLCCGKGFKMLKRHLGAEHGLTEAEYREMFDLPEAVPLVAPSYSKRKAKHAKQVGLGKYHRDMPERDDAYAE